MADYLTVFDSAAGEYTEKRSRFISGVYHCESEQDALGILSSVRSENFGANHNVYAYVLKDGTMRFSDDSEPHGTAGKPVLDVLLGSGVTDIIIVVTRYFGGVLLGTGGLVRSYSTAAKNALKNANVQKMSQGTLYNTTCEYTYYQNVVKLIEKHSGKLENTVFADKVTLQYIITDQNDEPFLKDLCEDFSSRITAKALKKDIFSFDL